MKKLVSTFCTALVATLMFGTVAYADVYVALQVDNSNMSVNGTIKSVGAMPTIRGGSTLVPLRSVVETLGGSVEWENSERKITISIPTVLTLYDASYTATGNLEAAEDFWITHRDYMYIEKEGTVGLEEAVEKFGGKLDWDDLTVTLQTPQVMNLWIDKNVALVNGAEKTLDVAPAIIDGNTMIPLRFVSENLGFNIKWVENGRYIIIADKFIDEASITFPPTPVKEEPKPAPVKEEPKATEKPSNSSSSGNPQLAQMNSAADAMYNVGIEQINIYQSAGIPVPASALSPLNQAYDNYRQTISIAGQLGIKDDPALTHAKNRVAEIIKIRGY